MEIEIELIEKIREDLTFANDAEAKEQIGRDIESVRSYFSVN